jgi:hypothetical protein
MTSFLLKLFFGSGACSAAVLGVLLMEVCGLGMLFGVVSRATVSGASVVEFAIVLYS